MTWVFFPLILAYLVAHYSHSPRAPSSALKSGLLCCWCALCGGGVPPGLGVWGLGTIACQGQAAPFFPCQAPWHDSQEWRGRGKKTKLKRLPSSLLSCPPNPSHALLHPLRHSIVLQTVSSFINIANQPASVEITTGLEFKGNTEQKYCLIFKPLPFPVLKKKILDGYKKKKGGKQSLSWNNFPW